MLHTGREAETVFLRLHRSNKLLISLTPLIKSKKDLQIFSVAELQTLAQVTSALLGEGNLRAGLLRVQHGENTESPWKILPLAHGLENW